MCDPQCFAGETRKTILNKSNWRKCKIKINENLESAFYEDNYVKKNESLIKVCEECLSVVAKVVPSLHKSRSPAQQSNLI